MNGVEAGSSSGAGRCSGLLSPSWCWACCGFCPNAGGHGEATGGTATGSCRGARSRGKPRRGCCRSAVSGAAGRSTARSRSVSMSGLLLVPLFFAGARAAVEAFGRASPGRAIPLAVANWLTLLDDRAPAVAVVRAACSTGRRDASAAARIFVWPLLLAMPFITGYLCATSRCGPQPIRADAACTSTPPTSSC